MRISEKGLEFIKAWEKFIPYVYDDKAKPIKIDGKSMPPRWAQGTPVLGVLTVGYGHTNLDKTSPTIQECLAQDLTESQAAEILDRDLDKTENMVNRLVKVPTAQCQFDALVSITFNMGSGNLKTSSLLAKLNRGDYDGALAAFDLYVKSGGKTMSGLQRRRDAEQKLWQETEQELPAEAPEHPLEIDQPARKKMSGSKIGNSQIAIGAGTALTTAATVGQQLLDSQPQIERVTNVIDQTGKVVDSTRDLIDRVPDNSVAQNLMLFVTDPAVIAVMGCVVVLLAGYTWLERARHAREGDF